MWLKAHQVMIVNEVNWTMLTMKDVIVSVSLPRFGWVAAAKIKRYFDWYLIKNCLEKLDAGQNFIELSFVQFAWAR